MNPLYYNYEAKTLQPDSTTRQFLPSHLLLVVAPLWSKINNLFGNSDALRTLKVRFIYTFYLPFYSYLHLNIISKEVQIVYRLFLVNCYLLHVPRLPSQPASNMGGWVIDWNGLNWLDTVVYNRNHYFDFSPIPIPKPKLVDGFGWYCNRYRNHLSKGRFSYQ